MGKKRDQLYQDETKQTSTKRSIYNKPIWTSGSNKQRRVFNLQYNANWVSINKLMSAEQEKGEGRGRHLIPECTDRWETKCHFPCRCQARLTLSQDTQFWPPHCKTAVDRQETIMNDKKAQKHCW